MQNLLSLWSTLDAGRRLIVVGATIAVFLAILGLSRMANTPNLALLYAGLNGAAAGEVIAALDQRGVAYEVRGDSIHVETTERDALRMALAGEGLPTTGSAGYELLDGLSGFGTTSQMFDAAYWRAKEGELGRTILSNPQIKAARVHIAQAPLQPFRQQTHASASVTVTTVSGSLNPNQAKALKHLVAAAVAGMQPEDVQIIDTVAGLIMVNYSANLSDPEGNDRAAALRHSIERLLEARVGIGRVAVEVSVDVVTEREQITQRTFDPQGRVAISTDTEEKSDNSSQHSGSVTVASNLPEGDVGAEDGGKSQSSLTRERVNFEVSETNRDLLKVPGAIRKLSVAVLVDGIQTIAADGSASWQPRPDEELGVLRELVASAVGLDETRGDVLTLKSLAFEQMAAEGTLVEAGMLTGIGPFDLMSGVQIIVLAAVSLVLGLFVIRPILMNTSEAPRQIQANIGPLALTNSMDGNTLDTGTRSNGLRVVTGEIEDLTLPELGFSAQDGVRTEQDPMSRLRRLIQERQAESVEILRGWMEAKEGDA